MRNKNRNQLSDITLSISKRSTRDVKETGDRHRNSNISQGGGHQEATRRQCPCPTSKEAMISQHDVRTERTRVRKNEDQNAGHSKRIPRIATKLSCRSR